MFKLSLYGDCIERNVQATQDKVAESNCGQWWLSTLQQQACKRTVDITQVAFIRPPDLNAFQCRPGIFYRAEDVRPAQVSKIRLQLFCEHLIKKRLRARRSTGSIG